MVGEPFEQVASAADNKIDAAVTAIGTLNAAHEIYNTCPNIKQGNELKNQLNNGNTEGLTNNIVAG